MTGRTRRALGAAALASLLLAGAGCGSGDHTQELAVVGTEMAFQAPASVAAGDYVVRFRNAGAVYHEVAIKDATGEVLRRVSAGPGQTVKMEVSLPRGQYELGCFEPGHYEGGMHRLLSVT
jgi:uncharacterized cupredoxin-like copper-binding protein